MEASMSDYDGTEAPWEPELACDVYNHDAPQFGLSIGFNRPLKPWFILHVWRWRLSVGWLF